MKTHSDTVDFTLMYLTHKAFLRDLRRLSDAIAERRVTEPAVHACWETFKRQLHVHHTAEDSVLWPPLRARGADTAVLDTMEAEHGAIDPLVDRIDAAFAAADLPAMKAAVDALIGALADHMRHEETNALPLVETVLGPEGWAAFPRRAREIQSLRGGLEYLPWMLDGASAEDRRRALALLPAPLRPVYRAVLRPLYARAH